jgi:hypothetical protein
LVREEKNNGKGGAKMDSKHVTLTCIFLVERTIYIFRGVHIQNVRGLFFLFF